MRYYCVRQVDLTDCGPACLATVARQNKVRLPIRKIRDRAGTDIKGTNLIGMVSAAEKIGFEAKAVRSKVQLLKPNSIPLPAIAHISTDALEHFVVIHKYNSKKILIADPGEGLRWQTWKSFQTEWTGALVLLTAKPEFFKQQSEKKIGLFRRFGSVVLPHKAYLIEIFLSSFLLSILGFAGTFYYRFLIDSILPSQSQTGLAGLSLTILAVTVFTTLLGAVRNQLTMHLANKLDVTLVLSVFNHIVRLPIRFFESRKSGEIMNRIGDTYTVRETLYGAMISSVLDSAMLVVAVFGLFFYDLPLVVTAFVPFLLSLVVMYLFARPFREMQKEKFKLDSEKDSQFYETVAGIATVKAMGAESSLMNTVEEKFVATVKKGMQMGVWSNVQGMVQGLVSSIGGLAVFWVGSYFVLVGSLSLGEIISFSAFMGMFLGPLGRLIGLQAALQNAFLAGDRLGEILDMDSEIEINKGTVVIETIQSSITFRNVSFAYGTRGDVLRDVSFEIKAGERIGVVGPTGSGKSTISKLLMKFYKVENGSILLDGRNLNDIDSTALRTLIGYVPQDVLMFSGTIRENISLGRPEATDQEIQAAAAMACAHDFIVAMPGRYEAKVAERGTSLSGGERQRVALARALLRKPKLFIFDEATSNLDAMTEKLIWETVEQVSEGTTSIVVAHRLATIRHCDRIIVVEDGRIVQVGSHLALLEEGGLYKLMWEQQMGTAT